MALSVSYMLRLVHIALLFGLCFAADPFVNFELELSYITVSPLGVPQQVIAVNGTFPGPTFNVTTNDNVVVNVNNKLDENLLITWPGVQMRRASWQDGVLGTNCPIPPNWNWTYQFQVKDQIGSFFYFPSLNLQRAAGGFGSFIITNRKIIPLPFSTPDGDINIMIGDWYTRNHTALRTDLDAGKDLGMPDGVLINGKGPYRYNTTLVPDGIDYETINVDPGKTYRIRVHNVGVSTCLNFRIQNHNLLLAETEGYYTSQQNYTSLDIYVGQFYSFLVTMDQNASSDYYIVASARFVNQSLWQSVTGAAVLHYSNSKGKAAGSLPDPSNDVYDTSFSLNQAMSIKHAFATLSFVCEIFIFLYVGMDALDMEKWRFVNGSPGTSVGVSSILLGLILVGRAAFVFPLSFIANLTRKSPHEKIDIKQQFTIWWAGLMRGAVSMALAYNQFTRAGHTQLRMNAIMITSTITVVLCSTVVFGLMTKPLVRILLPSPKHLNGMLSSEPTSPKSFTMPLLTNGHDSEADLGTHNIPRPTSLRMLLATPSNTVHYYWRKFDNAVMRPAFGGRGFVPFVAGSPIEQSVHQLQ